MLILTYLLHTNTDWAQFVVRTILGIVFFAHGAQKMFGWFKGPGLNNSIKAMHEHIHIPAALGFLAIAAEFFGGIGLIIGLFSRIAATDVVVIMGVAIVLVHGRHGLFPLVRGEFQIFREVIEFLIDRPWAMNRRARVIRAL